MQNFQQRPNKNQFLFPRAGNTLDWSLGRDEKIANVFDAILTRHKKPI